MMSEKFVSEYVEIFDENGSRQAVCVTDEEHTVSFEVKDEYVAMELANVLNEQQATINHLLDELKEYADKYGEQQATIQSLKEENMKLKDYIDTIFEDNTHIEKRFRANFDVSIYDSETEEYISAKDGLKEIANLMNKLAEENKQLQKNFDDIVQYASKIAKRNVILDEQIGKLQKELQKQ